MGGVITFDLEEYKTFCDNFRTHNSLHTCKWREFYFDEIFTKIQRGKRLIKANQTQGKTPYVSSSAINNGIDNFIDNDSGVRKFQNCISIANSGSVGSAFFHHYTFIASDHITKLENKQFSKLCLSFSCATYSSFE
ncbi:restriction endonuclease subunit S [Helicobacter monodelphidis]|uniref:restriction endonuclease subunit S n=1 Tax=Helicobacter sp. 15-1451 TaxID=2004995 RepID=UPI001C68553E|nr:restriction endonuclease subunit S [Helicobacter sp. 15-1451]